MAGGDGLLTATLINLTVAVVVLNIFSRVRISYDWCYAPRRDRHFRRKYGNRFLRSPPAPTAQPGMMGWLRQTWNITDEQIFDTAGMDALGYIRLFRLGFKIFSALLPVAFLVLVPVYATAGNEGVGGVERISLARVEKGSSRLWAAALCLWAFSGVSYKLIFEEYRYYLSWRTRHLRRAQLHGRGLSVLVQHLPADVIKGGDGALTDYFRGLYGDDFESAVLAKELPKLEKVAAKREAVVAKLEVAHAQLLRNRRWNEAVARGENPEAAVAQAEGRAARARQLRAKGQKKKKTFKARAPERPRHKKGCGPCACLCGSQVDSVRTLQEELDALNDEVAQLLAAEHPPMRAGFVTFNNPLMATIAPLVQHNATPYQLTCKPAPEPRDVFWPALSVRQETRSTRWVLSMAATFWLSVFYTIPVALVQSVTNMESLSRNVPFLEPIVESSPVVKAFLEGFLPTLGMLVFMLLLPRVLMRLSQFEGIEGHSWLQQAVVDKFFVFQVFNFFLVSALAGGIFAVLDELMANFKLSTITTLLGNSLPKVATFFASYIMLRSLSGFPLLLLNPGKLILGKWGRDGAPTPRKLEEATEPAAVDYGAVLPQHLLIFVLGLTYSVIAPVILPFVVVYMALGAIAVTYNAVWVHVQRFDSGGTFWPQVFNKLTVGIYVCQLTLLGVLALKEGPLQVTVCLPLPYLTLLWFRYTKNAFEKKCQYMPVQECVKTIEERRKRHGKQGRHSSSEEEEEHSDDSLEAGEAGGRHSSPYVQPVLREKPRVVVPEDPMGEKVRHDRQHHGAGDEQKQPAVVVENGGNVLVIEDDSEEGEEEGDSSSCASSHHHGALGLSQAPVPPRGRQQPSGIRITFQHPGGQRQADR